MWGVIMARRAHMVSARMQEKREKVRAEEVWSVEEEYEGRDRVRHGGRRPRRRHQGGRVSRNA